MKFWHTSLELKSLLFDLKKRNSKPMFSVICDFIRAKIHAGELSGGMPMPSTRKLAEDLAISRSTVIKAYDQLVAEGYIQGVKGSGYLVCAIGSTEKVFRAEKCVDNPLNEESPALGKLLIPGMPDMRAFPYRNFAKTLSRVCRAKPESLLVGSSSLGNVELRQAIANHVREWRGVNATNQQVIVTAGATEALKICLLSIAQKGAIIGVEDPGYVPISNSIVSLAMHPLYLPVCKEGAAVPSLSTQANVAILTPSHQYPLGGAMSFKRRLEYIDWACDSDSWIIEDDYDSEFRYSGSPIPALASIDELKRTIYIGSFAKTFSNSIRLGYIVAPVELVETMSKVMSEFGLKAGLLPQQAVADFILTGEYYRYLRKVRKLYKDRLNCMVGLLNKDFEPFGHVYNFNAGTQIVFHLDNRFDDVAIVDEANLAGVFIEALSQTAKHSECYNGFIIGFCHCNEQEIAHALAILRSILQRFDLYSQKET